MNVFIKRRLEKNEKTRKNYNYMLKLCKKSGEYLEYVDPSIIDTNLLKSITKYSYKIGNLDMNLFNDPEIKYLIYINGYQTISQPLTLEEIEQFYRIDPNFLSSDSTIAKNIIINHLDDLYKLDLEIFKAVALSGEYELKKVTNLTREQIMFIMENKLCSLDELLINNMSEVTEDLLLMLDDRELSNILSKDYLDRSNLKNIKITTLLYKKYTLEGLMINNITKELLEYIHNQDDIEYKKLLYKMPELLEQKEIMIHAINYLNKADFTEILRNNKYYIDEEICNMLIESDFVLVGNIIYEPLMYKYQLEKCNDANKPVYFDQCAKFLKNHKTHEELMKFIEYYDDTYGIKIENISRNPEDATIDIIEYCSKKDSSFLLNIDESTSFFIPKLYDYIMDKSEEYPELFTIDNLIKNSCMSSLYKRFIVMKDLNYINEYPNVFDNKIYNELIKNIDNIVFKKESVPGILRNIKDFDFNNQNAYIFINKLITSYFGNNEKSESITNTIIELGKKNNDICTSINLDFLYKYSEYICLNDVERLLAITNEVELQKQLNELSLDSIIIIGKLIQASLTNSNGEKISNWRAILPKILMNSIDKIDIINMLSGEQINDQLINNLKDYLLNELPFNIDSIDDLINYQNNKNNYFEDFSFAELDIDMYKEKMLESIFQTSYTVIRKSYEPYYEYVFENKNKIDPRILSYFELIKRIIEEQDIEILKSINIDKKVDLDCPLYMVPVILKEYLSKDFNDQLLKVSDRQEDMLGQVEDTVIYAAGGINGDKPFTMDIHSIGAYSKEEISTEFATSWYRPKTSYHGICTSVITEENMGTAIIQGVVLGFDSIESSAILVGSPTDMNTDAINLKINTSDFELGIGTTKPSHYHDPRTMSRHTRHPHNEIVMERTSEGKKRNPGYLILIVDEYNKEFLNAYEQIKDIIDFNNLKDLKNIQIIGYSTEEQENIRNQLIHYHCSLMASKQFGNLPIMVVEQKKVLENQMTEIDNLIEEFELGNLKDKEFVFNLIDTIICKIASIQAGLTFHQQLLTGKDFTRFSMKILEIINNTDDLEICNNIIEGLESAVIKEQKIVQISDTNCAYASLYYNLANQCRNNMIIKKQHNATLGG